MSTPTKTHPEPPHSINSPATALMQTDAGEATELSTGQKVAAGVGLAAAAVVGVAAIRKALSASRSNGSGASSSAAIFHLEPEGDAWKLRLEGSSASPEVSFSVKAEGLEAARELAREHAPSELVIHRVDGSEQDRHRYSPEA